ncbi:MAG: tetratricopeptide repeat-containing glycosyltransferase family protein [Alphaproteobacteria bacterium]
MALAATSLMLAVRFLDAGKDVEAETLCRQVLEKDADHPGALRLLAVIARRHDQIQTAVDLLRHATNRLPEDADLFADLGHALKTAGRLDEAVASYQRAVDLAPTDAVIQSNLGVCLDAAGRGEEAIAAHRRAVTLAPDDADSLCNLGAALQRTGASAEAAACFQRAVARDPDSARAATNLGVALQEMGRLEDAIVCHRRSIALTPDVAEAHYNLAIACLRRGDLEEGWREFEWRLRMRTVPRRTFPCPRWAGESLQGRSILLHAEQGLGDTIQFLRYAALLARRGARVVVEAQSPLRRLLPSAHGVAEVCGPEALPPTDVFCPLLSLAGVFGTTLDTIPAEVPYLGAPPLLVERWRQRFASWPGLRVGIVWAGNPNHPKDFVRSLPLEALLPLGDVAGVRFFSLQLGAAALSGGGLSGRLHVVDLAPSLGDFADTAAAIVALDLVITVDTAVAHLAGALGRPVWVMLAHASDWRWLTNRDDSPWYPTARLFRQSAPGDWSGVVQRIRTALTAVVGGAVIP